MKSKAFLKKVKIIADAGSEFRKLIDADGADAYGQMCDAMLKMARYDLADMKKKGDAEHGRTVEDMVHFIKALEEAKKAIH